jgi:hypothetical protein
VPDYAVTNADGEYTVKGLSPGTYYLRTVNETGYIDELHDDVLCINCNVRTAGTALTVAEGTELSGRAGGSAAPSRARRPTAA